MADRISDLTKAIHTGKRNAHTVAQMLVNIWAVYFGTPLKVLMENGRQITSKYFQEMYGEFRGQFLTATEYNSQANSPVEHCNAATSALLRNYIAEH